MNVRSIDSDGEIYINADDLINSITELLEAEFLKTEGASVYKIGLRVVNSMLKDLKRLKAMAKVAQLTKD